MTTRLPAVLCVLLMACAPLRPLEPNAANVPAAPSRVAVIAHRGGAALMPENTLGAFRNALALGVDVLEMDAHLSKDGEVVVIHDATLERTTDGRGPVAGRTLAELSVLNAAAKFGSGAAAREPVPAFAQVLDLARDSAARIEVEIKVPPQGRYAGIEDALLRAVRERGMTERVQISSFDFRVLEDVKRAAPEARTVALMSVEFFRAVSATNPAQVVAAAQAAGAGVIAVNKDFLTADLVQAAHARQVAVEAWTVDTEPEMQRLVQFGVDGIISNRPDLLKRLAGR